MQVDQTAIIPNIILVCCVARPHDLLRLLAISLVAVPKELPPQLIYGFQLENQIEPRKVLADFFIYDDKGVITQNDPVRIYGNTREPLGVHVSAEKPGWYLINIVIFAQVSGKPEESVIATSHPVWFLFRKNEAKPKTE